MSPTHQELALPTPAAEEEFERLYAAMMDREDSETVQGSILRSLQEIAAKEGVEARWESMLYGRDIFHYGQKSTFLQGHMEQGLMRHYTQMLDLQKPWWRKAFLEEQYHGDLDSIGLIAPPLSDLLSLYAPNALPQFSLRQLIVAAGKDASQLPEEYVENAVFSSDAVHKYCQEATQAIATFLCPITRPEFDVQFNDGNGDLIERLRVVPQTPEATLALINGGKMIESVVEKIVASRDGLIAHLRGTL